MGAGKKSKQDRLSEEAIPASDDVRWPAWAARIDAVLERPMQAREIREALPEFSIAVLNNTLSWMDLRGIILRTKMDGYVLWSRASTAAKPSARPPRCGRCAGPWTRSITGIICLYCGRCP